MQESSKRRGFQDVSHNAYAPKATDDHFPRLVGQSSAIDIHNIDALDKPGSSFLWVGEHHHLNRDEVQQFVAYLTRWLETGLLFDIEEG